jgi:plasmid stability protein
MTLIINIPPELERRLQKEASRKGVALEEYARMLLEEQLAPTGDRASRKGDAWAVLKSMMGTVEGPADWSSELDHYLYGTPKRS